MKTRKFILATFIVLLIPIFGFAQEAKFNAYVNAGGLYEINYNIGGVKIDLGAGCRLNKHLYLGVNIGTTMPIYGDQYGKPWSPPFDPEFPMGLAHVIPMPYTHFAANAKLFLPIDNSRITPFLDVNIGANIDTKARCGLYMSYGIGAEIGRISTAIGYEVIGSHNYPGNHLGHILNLKIGVRLGR